MPSKRIYLASRSPRRRELLRQIGIGFEILLLREHPSRSDVDETPLPDEAPEDYVMRLCRAKAEPGWRRVLERRLPQLPVLAADTTVALGNEIIGKPASADEAVATLRRLSGRTHWVYTGVAVANGLQVYAACSVSEVWFRELEEHEIRNYVATGEPLDKAGSYAVQGRGAVFVAHLNGSYSGVMGLPLFETAQLLRQVGLPVL